MSVPERYCAKGERCRLYDPETGRSQKLGAYHRGDVCDRCRKAESDAGFEAHQRTLSVKYERANYQKNPLKGRLVVLKRNLVARLIAKRGGYWEAIREVRDRWQLDPVPRQLPPDSDCILYPPSIPARQPPTPLEYIFLPDIPNPHMGEPGDLEQYESWLDSRRRWVIELGNVLRRGVPERYLGEETPPYEGWAPSQERWLPWYRFASGCVLYDPPVREAPAFADYGGLPLLSREGTKDEPLLNVLTERELREGTIDLEVQNIDLLPENWSSYYGSPTAHNGHKEGSLWANETPRSRSSASSGMRRRG